MDIEVIKRKVDGIPHMDFSQATRIRELIIENKFANILELGFRHGVSTCYMAGALDELGFGTITTIDLTTAKHAKPNIEDLLGELNLIKYVTLFYEPTSYVWRLMKMIEEDSTPRFDFCYLDGAHDWYTDGFAFFLVDMLLKPGGIIVFDDLDWRYDISPGLKNSEKVKNMPEEEKTTPQVRKVYELLVKNNPSYSEFEEIDNWGIVRKKSSIESANSEIRTEIIHQKEYIGLGAITLKAWKRLTKRQ